ncbi:MAG: malate dehydrogenase (quinone) [Deltaproteobacteria bacterium]|nr:malate dehydrogenase (quinone) [Deltaproteobacteria bacterium]
MSDEVPQCDVLLVGAGIMSATVATLLRELDPTLRVELFERLDRPAGESSHARHNAGTGHAALCELNYTPEKNGTIDITKAVQVMERFEISKQLWGWLVENGALPAPETFIRSVPHLSFVTGEDDARFLRRRHEALGAHPLFSGMEHSEDLAVLRGWMPLVIEGRRDDGPVAATRSHLGTDVDFGAITCGMLAHLERAHRVMPYFSHEVRDVARADDGGWEVEVRDLSLDLDRTFRAKFVFLGAGGGALDLLHESEIEEARGYGGFPVSGLWLVCKNPDVVARHAAKVYAKAKVGAPPMSVPHLDTRFIDGRRELLFGPFAGFSTKFLKEGSYLDLPTSLRLDNLLEMIGAGLHNLPLTRYLLDEVTQSFASRIEALRELVPDARAEDWELEVAGQRVQVIKHDDDDWGRLEFGTEIVSAKDNSLAALLGASPGASTSVSVALDLLLDCFPERMESAAWKSKLEEMIPGYARSLSNEPTLARALRETSHRRLRLDPP